MSEMEKGETVRKMAELPAMQKAMVEAFIDGMKAGFQNAASAVPSQSAALTAPPAGEPSTEVENG